MSLGGEEIKCANVDFDFRHLHMGALIAKAFSVQLTCEL
jgi:hypothetical protein